MEGFQSQPHDTCAFINGIARFELIVPTNQTPVAWYKSEFQQIDFTRFSFVKYAQKYTSKNLNPIN